MPEVLKTIENLPKAKEDILKNLDKAFKEEPRLIQKKTQSMQFQFLHCNPEDADTQYIKAYYGLPEDLNPHRLVTQSDEMKRIYMINESILDLLKADIGHKLNIISLGVMAFVRNVSRFSNTECIYRIGADGSRYVAPHLGKRITKTNKKEFFKDMLKRKNTKEEDLAKDLDPEAVNEIDRLSIGCFLFMFTGQDGKFDSVTMHKFHNSVSLMENKTNLFNLHMRYFTEQERSEFTFVETEDPMGKRQ